MDKYKLIEKQIDNLTKKAAYRIEYSHSHSVLEWILKLKPKADISLKIAALGHDIDRCIEPITNKKDFDNYDLYKKFHASRSAKIIVELMKKLDFDKKKIDKTKFLIENHEIGGKGDAEILKEADSLSFFENNLKHYIEINPYYVKDKIRFMYSRLSKKARKLVLKVNFENEKIRETVEEAILDIK